MAKWTVLRYKQTFVAFKATEPGIQEINKVVNEYIHVTKQGYVITLITVSYG